VRGRVHAAHDIAKDDCADEFEDARECIEDASCSGGGKLELDDCESIGDDLGECTDGDTKIDAGDESPLRWG
jgi:hypothetical protein